MVFSHTVLLFSRFFGGRNGFFLVEVRGSLHLHGFFLHCGWWGHSSARVVRTVLYVRGVHTVGHLLMLSGEALACEGMDVNTSLEVNTGLDGNSGL